MPRFEAGDHVGKAAVQIQMCGQLPQPVRGPRPARDRSRRRGRFQHSDVIVGDSRRTGTPVTSTSVLPNWHTFSLLHVIVPGRSATLAAADEAERRALLPQASATT